MATTLLCLEAYYSEDPADESSVRPLLELIAANVSGVTFVHRYVSTREDAGWYLDN